MDFGGSLKPFLVKSNEVIPYLKSIDENNGGN